MLQSPSSPSFYSKVSQDTPRALRNQRLSPYSKEPATDLYPKACNSSPPLPVHLFISFLILLLFFHAFAQTLRHAYLAYCQLSSTVSVGYVLPITNLT